MCPASLPRSSANPPKFWRGLGLPRPPDRVRGFQPSVSAIDQEFEARHYPQPRSGYRPVRLSGSTAAGRLRLRPEFPETSSKSLCRNPDLLFSFDGDRVLVRDLSSGRSIRASVQIVGMLDLFRRPVPPEAVAAALPFNRQSVLGEIERLRAAGLLVSPEVARRKQSRLKAWN